MLLHKEITSEIINVFYKVYNTLGYGFLEKIYENARKSAQPARIRVPLIL